MLGQLWIGFRACWRWPRGLNGTRHRYESRRQIFTRDDWVLSKRLCCSSWDAVKCIERDVPVMLSDQASSDAAPTNLPRSIASRLGALALQPIALPIITWPVALLSALSLLPRWVFVASSPVLLYACGAALLSFRIDDKVLEAHILGVRIWAISVRGIIDVKIGTVRFGAGGSIRGIVVVARRTSGVERDIELSTTALMSRFALTRWVERATSRLTGSRDA